MKNTRSIEKMLSERVVRIVETCDGSVARTFYCILDPDLDHWMSDETFDGMIWTKDPKRRREFDSRWDAESELEQFLGWRREQDPGDDIPADIHREQEAA